MGSKLERADELKILSSKTQSAQVFFLKGQRPGQRSLWSSVSHKREGTTLQPPTPNPVILSIPPLKAKLSALEGLAPSASSLHYAKNSAPTEGSDPLPSNVSEVAEPGSTLMDSTLAWLEAIRRPANLETLRPPCDAFVPILAPASLFAGKLGRFVLNCGQLTDDNWVLNTVRGHRLP